MIVWVGTGNGAKTFTTGFAKELTNFIVVLIGGADVAVDLSWCCGVLSNSALLALRHVTGVVRVLTSWAVGT